MVEIMELSQIAVNTGTFPLPLLTIPSLSVNDFLRNSLYIFIVIVLPMHLLLTITRVSDLIIFSVQACSYKYRSRLVLESLAATCRFRVDQTPHGKIFQTQTLKAAVSRPRGLRWCWPFERWYMMHMMFGAELATNLMGPDKTNTKHDEARWRLTQRITLDSSGQKLNLADRFT